MLRGSARHSELNGGVECVSRTLEEKLGAWMRETGNINWSIGRRLMMWRYNTQTHRTVDEVPYNLLFGHMPRVGISNLPLANELINTLATEAQLNKVCDYIGKVVIPDDKLSAVIGDDNNVHEVLEGQEGDDNNVHKVLQGQGDQDQAAEAVFNAEIAYAEMITAPNNENDGVLVGEIGNPDDNEDGDDDSGIPVATIVLEPEQEPALGAAASSSIANRKTAEDKEDNGVSRWETTVQNVPNDFTMDGLQDIRLRVSVPVAWCKNVCNVVNLMSFVAFCVS